MAIAYKSQGAGASTQTSGAALSPACPAVVDAGDILIGHVYWEGTSDAPSTPANWTLLYGPAVVQSTIGRHWVFGKVADGTEDGAAVAFGNPAVTTQRGARVYSFSGRISGTITQLVKGFSETSNATDPAMPTVVTTAAGNRAVALVAQNDNNTAGAATGATGGTWTEAVAEYSVALTPGLMMQIQTCVPTADPGTVTGGTTATTNDPAGVIGFEIAQEVAAYVLTADTVAFNETGTAASLEKGFEVAADTIAYAVVGTAASLEKGFVVIADTATYAETGTDAGLLKKSLVAADTTAYAVTGTDATLGKGLSIVAATVAFTISGTDASLEKGAAIAADTAAFNLTGTDANLEFGRVVAADTTSYSVAGTDASLERGYRLAADSGTFAETGTDAGTLYGRSLVADTVAYAVAGTVAGTLFGRRVGADSSAYVVTGTDATLTADGADPVLVADTVGYTWAGTDATLDQNAWDNRPIRTAVTAAAWA